MMNTYKKPVVTVDAGMAEGVYAASGAAQGTLNVTYYGVWDRWGTNGGKGLAMANWSDLNGTITLNITFNDTVDQAETDDASVQASWSGKTATFTFASTASNQDSSGTEPAGSVPFFKILSPSFQFPLRPVPHTSYRVSHKLSYRYLIP